MQREKPKLIAATILLFALVVVPITSMSCSYGARGSLTVFCLNATPRFFRLSSYRFDHLDETLICQNCTLENLTEGSFDIPSNQIKTLVIANSTIKNIYPKAFVGLIFVEKINLSDNPIQMIMPEAFAGIRKVKVLEMVNTVSSLKAYVFRELHMLENLNLRNSRLTVLEPGIFEGLYNLRYLDISNNSLRSISYSFDPLVNLEVLILRDNNLKHLHGTEFQRLRSLFALDLSSNLIENFTIHMEKGNKLRILSLKENVLDETKFDVSPFSDLALLEELDLSKNALESIPPRFLLGLHHLTKLNLDHNRLMRIDTGRFSGLPHLSILNVSSNELKDLVVTGHLELASLHYLDLSNNNIHFVAYSSLIRRMRHLSFINLDGNPLPCEMMTDLIVQMEADGLDFLMNLGDQDCKDSRKSSSELVKEMVEDFSSRHGRRTFVTTISVLIAVIVLLLLCLFYTQFFVLYKMRLRPISFSVIRKPEQSGQS